MSVLGKALGLFPLFYFLGVLVIGHVMFSSYEWYLILILFSWIYLLPLACMKIQNLFLKLDEGYWDFGSKKFHPWWGAYMFQFPFITCPWLENILHFIPGAFSLWLRAWGSKVGKGVYFTSRVEFLDRTLMEIGDGVVFGHMAVFSCHMIINKEGRDFLMIRKIKLGKKSFIGADVQMGPGVVIKEGEVIPVKKRLSWRGEYNCS